MEVQIIAAIIIYLVSLIIGVLGLQFSSSLATFFPVERVQVVFALSGWIQVLVLGCLVLFRLWVPHPAKLALASVRFCRVGASVAFVGPIGLLGVDTFIARIPGGFEIKMEHAGATALVGTFLCLYYMNKFEDRFDRHWRSYHRSIM